MRQTLVPAAHDGVYAGWPRTLSLLLAIVLTGMVLTYPRALADASHGMLSLMMLGISAGFVHGVGFKPEFKLWRILFGPWIAWPMMSLGFWLMLRG